MMKELEDLLQDAKREACLCERAPAPRSTLTRYVCLRCRVIETLTAVLATT